MCAASNTGQRSGNAGGCSRGGHSSGERTGWTLQTERVGDDSGRHTAVNAVDPGPRGGRVGEGGAGGELPAAARQNAGVRGEVGKGHGGPARGRCSQRSQEEETPDHLTSAQAIRAQLPNTPQKLTKNAYGKSFQVISELSSGRGCSPPGSERRRLASRGLFHRQRWGFLLMRDQCQLLHSYMLGLKLQANYWRWSIDIEKQTA